MTDDLHIDFLQLFSYEGIPVANAGDRHYRHGWVSLECPFCVGDAGNHLGYSPKYNIFTCWRCGRHTKGDVLAALLHKPKREAVEYAKEHYGLDEYNNSWQPEVEVAKADKLIIPGSKRIPIIHHRYLTDRGFDPDTLAKQWDLYFTTYHTTHAWRLIAPIWDNGRYVSYVGRAVSKDEPTRYLTCMPEKEVADCKICVFGMQYAVKDSVIIVEGMFDAFRIGHGAVAVLGTGWKQQQADKIAKHCKTSYILFDPESDAQRRAASLATNLSSHANHKSYVLTMKGTTAKDPAELNEDEVAKIRELIK